MKRIPQNIRSAAIHTIAYALLLALACGLLCGCEVHEHAYEKTVVAPTCHSIGYTVNECSCGNRFYSDYQASTPHTYSAWIAGREATYTMGGEEYCVCEVCGVLKTRDTESLSALPKLYLTDLSDTPSADGRQKMSLLYSHGDTLRFSCQTALLTTDTSAKSSFDLQLVTADGSTPYPVDLGWGERSHYRLSAELPDRTLSRTATAWSLWLACAQLRDNAENNPTANWTMDGQNGSILVQVVKNGVYLGLYAILPPETDWGYTVRGTSGSSPTAALYTVGTGEVSCFHSAPTFADARGYASLQAAVQDWLENAEPEDAAAGTFLFLSDSASETEWAENSFAAFSAFVRQTRDSAFRRQLNDYSDTEVLMDYFLLSTMLGTAQGDTEKTVWYTGDGIHWLPSFCDLRTGLGISASGLLRTEADDIPLPGENGKITYNGTNQLWKRITELYPDELRARYAVLREELLKPEGIYLVFLQQYRRPEAELFEAEQTLYPTLQATEGEVAQMLSSLRRRAEAMDAWLGYEE